MRTHNAALAAVAVILVNCTSGDPSFERPSEKGELEPLAKALSSSSNVTIAAGRRHACSLFRGGKIACWGDNTFGQLGNGTTTHEYAPVVVTGITSAVAVSAGAYHTCALLTDKTIRCWGRNHVGQLGNGTMTNSSTPVTVSGITNATAVAAGGGPDVDTTTEANGVVINTEYRSHTCARLENSTVKCWGWGGNGELGNGSSVDQGYSTPVSVSGISTATGIAVGRNHSCALLSTNTIKCWGLGANGQLGYGGTSLKSTPVAVYGISTATAIAAGYAFTCARLSNSTLKCWGDNDSGQLGTGTTTQRLTPASVSNTMQARTSHACTTRMERRRRSPTTSWVISRARRMPQVPYASNAMLGTRSLSSDLAPIGCGAPMMH